jgi:hypothetical protein
MRAHIQIAIPWGVMDRSTLAMLLLVVGNVARAQSPPQAPLPHSAAPAGTAVAPELNEHLLSFDPWRAEVAWESQRWQLVAGGVPLKDFGRREAEARQALRLVRDLGLNQYGTVGGPAPVMEYWLIDGRAPHGPVSGLRSISLDLAHLKVEQAGSAWCLCDGPRALFKFGLRPEEARRAEAVVRKYGFNRLVLVGQAMPSMLVFLADETATTAQAARRSPPAHAAGRKDAGPGTALTTTAKYYGADVGSLVTPAVPPLRAGPHPEPGPRTPFESGSAREFPRGRQMGVTKPPREIERMADCVAFDWRLAEVRPGTAGWELAASGQVLARFGDRELEAREALAVLRHFRLTEQMVVGRPTYFAYFLSGGRPPQGVPLGAVPRAFQPDGLSLRALGGRWCICDNEDPLLKFGQDRSEAQDFLALIRRERLDRLLLLGPTPEGGLTILARAR